jgi:hypothetical protein
MVLVVVFMVGGVFGFVRRLRAFDEQSKNPTLGYFKIIRAVFFMRSGKSLMGAELSRVLFIRQRLAHQKNRQRNIAPAPCADVARTANPPHAVSRDRAGLAVCARNGLGNALSLPVATFSGAGECGRPCGAGEGAKSGGDHGAV